MARRFPYLVDRINARLSLSDKYLNLPWLRGNSLWLASPSDCAIFLKYWRSTLLRNDHPGFEQYAKVDCDHYVFQSFNLGHFFRLRWQGYQNSHLALPIEAS